jgi:hypothetical protein
VLAAKRAQYPALRTTDIGEPGAYGAARMAASAAGLSLPDALSPAGPVAQTAGMPRQATGSTAQVIGSTEESKGR